MWDGGRAEGADLWCAGLHGISDSHYLGVVSLFFVMDAPLSAGIYTFLQPPTPALVAGQIRNKTTVILRESWTRLHSQDPYSINL